MQKHLQDYKCTTDKENNQLGKDYVCMYHGVALRAWLLAGCWWRKQQKATS
jgi:hypothetical protein